MRRGFAVAASLLMTLGIIVGPAAAAAQQDVPEARAEGPSQAFPDQVTLLLRWVTESGDNRGMPVVIIDKIAATVFLFDPDGQFVGAAPALVGITPGDDSAAGVGDRELSNIPVEDRTTPAGRFIAKFGFARGKRKVLWVDYATSISLHAVVTGNRKERRLHRLKSPSAEDNRITFGCINVPADFYAKLVRPMFKDNSGVVYILPETKPLAAVFPQFQAASLSAPAVTATP